MTSLASLFNYFIAAGRTSGQKGMEFFGCNPYRGTIHGNTAHISLLHEKRLFRHSSRSPFAVQKSFGAIIYATF